MFQHIAIFLSALLIVITTQTCCPPPSATSSDKRSINILIPVSYPSTISELGGLRDRLGGLGGGLGGLEGGLNGLPSRTYFGYFTRYLGPANANGMCPAGVNINGQCWYNSIGNSKR
ncbi:hypothetical protein ACH3XW_11430 [Acanthocheilonema viteae]